jgi:biopolymer transport protein ExbB
MADSFSAVWTQGGLTLYPLGICSIITVAVFLERLWYYRGAVRGTKDLTARVVGYLEDNDLPTARTSCERVRSPASRIFSETLLLRERTPERIAQSLDISRTQQILLPRERLWILGTIGSMSPFIGLLGTVIGIIKSFRQMALTGSGGFAVVAAGISEALIATAAGLVVAIVAIVAYNYLIIRANRIATELRVSCQSLSGALNDLEEPHGRQ